MIFNLDEAESATNQEKQNRDKNALATLINLTETAEIINLIPSLSTFRVGKSIENLKARPLFRADRDPSYEKSGGGCLIADKAHSNSTLLPVPADIKERYNNIDFVVIQSTILGREIILCCVYIPPDTSADSYEGFLKEMSNVSIKLAVELIILDDFHTPNLENNNQASPDKKYTALLEFASILNLEQYNSCCNLDLVFPTF